MGQTYDFFTPCCKSGCGALYFFIICLQEFESPASKFSKERLWLEKKFLIIV